MAKIFLDQGMWSISSFLLFFSINSLRS
jgi:hypothetical protein